MASIAATSSMKICLQYAIDLEVLTKHPQSGQGHSNGNLSSGPWPQGADHAYSCFGPTLNHSITQMSCGPECHKFSWDNHAKNITLLNTHQKVQPGCEGGPTQLPPRSLFSAPSSSSAFHPSLRLAYQHLAGTENKSHPFTSYGKPHIQSETLHLSSQHQENIPWSVQKSEKYRKVPV